MRRQQFAPYVYSDSFQEETTAEQERTIISRKYNLSPDFAPSILSCLPGDYRFILKEGMTVIVKTDDFEKQDLRQILLHFGFDRRKKMGVKATDFTTTFTQENLAHSGKE